MDEIFAYLYQLSLHGNLERLYIRAKKEILKATCISKKLKCINDLIFAKTSQITVLRDQWIINNNKKNPNLKV